MVLAHVAVYGLGTRKFSSKYFHFEDFDILNPPMNFSNGKRSANTLYVPQIFNYPRIDAVSVSFVTEKGPKKAVCAHITFIQITVGDKKVDRIASTISILNDEKARQRWLEVIPENFRASAVFSLHWFVADHKVEQKIVDLCSDPAALSASSSESASLIESNKPGQFALPAQLAKRATPKPSIHTFPASHQITNIDAIFPPPSDYRSLRDQPSTV
jgi:hypothetical protein